MLDTYISHPIICVATSNIKRINDIKPFGSQIMGFT